MKFKPLTFLTVTALILTACSNQEPEVAPKPDETATEVKPEEGTEEPVEYNADTPTGYPTNADYYFFGDGRVVGKFSIPTEPSEDVLEVFNELVPEDESTFIKVTVDNREGESQYSVDTIAGYDSDGKEYEFQDFGGSMSDPLWSMWEDIDLDDDAAIDTHDRLEDMVYSFDTNIEPGAVKDVWLISEETDLPDEFTRLGVNGGSSYMGGSDPLPVEMAEFDLSFEAPTD